MGLSDDERRLLADLKGRQEGMFDFWLAVASFAFLAALAFFVLH